MEHGFKLLSIIIPSYNMEAYLPKCLQSLVIDDCDVLNKLEVIVVNDGSKDRTSAIAHDFEERYPGVFHVIDKGNGHYGSCVNSGLEIATGKYVKILDADDFFDTQAFGGYMTLLVELANNEEEIDLVVTDYCVVSAEGKIDECYSQDLPEDSLFTMRDFKIKGNFFLNMHAIAYRTDILREIGYRQTEGICYTDMQWVFIPMTKVRHAYYKKLPVYQYLLGRDGQSMNPQVRSRNLKMYYKLIHDMLEQYKDAKESFGLGDADLYLDNVLYAIAAHIYYETLLNIKPVGALDELLQLLDRRLAELAPQIYEKLKNCKVARFCPFHYVDSWRKTCNSRMMLFYLSRSYLALHKMTKRRIRL